jgi:hypothetical protein
VMAVRVMLSSGAVWGDAMRFPRRTPARQTPKGGS